MVRHLRRRLPEMWDNVLAHGERGRRLIHRGAATAFARIPLLSLPALNLEGQKEQIKTRVQLLNTLALGVLAAGVVNPAIVAGSPITIKTRVGAVIIAWLLVVAGQRLLHYIPDTSAPKETDHV
jgi:hypothetical protein